MKKYQLLERAMRDYPAGKVCTWGQEEFVSNGIFRIDDEGDVRLSGSDFDYVIFDGDNWATIVPEEKPSILSGKCAIQVNNEREFKLLTEHYENKGWLAFAHLPNEGQKPKDCSYNAIAKRFGEYALITYGNGFCFPHNSADADWLKPENYRQVAFSDFAAEVDITVPVFVMTSEDGVPLYEGDEYWVAELNPIFKNWSVKLLQTRLGSFNIHVAHGYAEGNTDTHKAFSTKEAAEAWIKEQNKPKSIIVSEFSQYPVEVTAKKFTIKCGNSDNHLDNLVIHSGELEEIYKAYKSLQ